jgi:hypothetical protein
MDSQVRYSHFTPDRHEHQICADILNMVNDLAPSDAFVEANVDQTDDGHYKASILVRGCCGDFHSESSGRSVLGTIKKAQQDILHTMKEWKTHRFALS